MKFFIDSTTKLRRFDLAYIVSELDETCYEEDEEFENVLVDDTWDMWADGQREDGESEADAVWYVKVWHGDDCAGAFDYRYVVTIEEAE